MAGFFLISAADPQIRSQAQERAKLHLSPVPCEWRMEENGRTGLIFALRPHTPFSKHELPDGTAVLLLGRPIGDKGAVTAEEISGYLERGDLPPLGGLFVWFMTLPDGSVRLGSDPFSLMPVFHRERNGVVEITSSPAAIRAQDGFVPEIDPVGLARYLIGHGSSGVRSPDRGIRRLANGRELAISRSGEIRFHPGPGFFPTDFSPNVSFEDARDETNHLLADAIRRHHHGGAPDLLYSGGMDSRLLLAHLTAQGHAPRCLTRGCHGDDEVVFARKSSRHAGCEWKLVEDDFSRALVAAKAEVDLLSLSAGFSGIFYMLDLLDAAPRAGGTFNGFFLDAILDPLRGIGDWRKHPTFEEEFPRRMNLFGIAPARLKAMLASPIHQQAVDEAVAEMRAEWEDLSDLPRIRLWQSQHRFRTNHHLGGILWKNSFASWPAFVALDLPLIRRLMEFPAEHLLDRQLERSMLIRMSPALAKIPLDGNSLWNKPLIETLGSRITLKGRQIRARYFPKTVSTDTRRYHRILNMNSEAWSEIRRETDALRGNLETVFDRKALKAYFPRPRHPVPAETGDAISNHAGRRMLAGLAIYLEQTGQR